MTTTSVAVIGDHRIQNSPAMVAHQTDSLRSGQLATSDRERASRLRSAPVAISHGPDLGRRYFDGGCPMPATSAVEPVLPVEGAAPVSAVEHVRPSTGRANERAALPDVPVKGAAPAPTVEHGYGPSTGTRTMVDAVAAIVGWAA